MEINDLKCCSNCYFYNDDKYRCRKTGWDRDGWECCTAWDWDAIKQDVRIDEEYNGN